MHTHTYIYIHIYIYIHTCMHALHCIALHYININITLPTYINIHTYIYYIILYIILYYILYYYILFLMHIPPHCSLKHSGYVPIETWKKIKQRSKQQDQQGCKSKKTGTIWPPPSAVTARGNSSKRPRGTRFIQGCGRKGLMRQIHSAFCWESILGPIPYGRRFA